MANNTLLASDNFASGSLAAGWSTAQAATNTCAVTGSAPYYSEPRAVGEFDGQVWTGIAWPNDQTSELTIKTCAEVNGVQIALLVRWQAASISGYEARVISNGSSVWGIAVNRFDSGSSNTLFTSGPVTIATGDVFSFSVTGSILTVYQNGTLLCYKHDTTYTSGNPGYFQYTNGTAVTNSQVSSWRGYSAVQQDGIWQKQGIPAGLVPIVADFTSSGTGMATCSKILYEGGSQLGLGAGNVYKMWFAGQQPAAANAGGNIGYAESLDGLTWTRRSTPVLNGYVSPGIWKSGSTYYMLAQPITGYGTSPYAVLTSSDGITWALQNASGIPLGTGGAWDSGVIYGATQVAIIGGTWYALYYASNGGVYSTGLATSGDGITWTKYGSNPVVSGFAMQQAIYTPDNSTFYLWRAEASTGRGAPDPFDPSSGVRYKVTNGFTTWTNLVHGIQTSEAFEMVNALIQQAWFNAFVEVGGKTYAYYTEGVDGMAPLVYQLGLAIAPTTLANIVQGNEDAAQQIATDSFTSGIGDLSANWTIQGGSPWFKLQVIAGNIVEGTHLEGNSGAIYTGAAFAADQYSDVTVNTMGSGSSVSPIVRGSTSVSNMYFANVLSGSPYASIELFSFVGGVLKVLGPTTSATIITGDVIRLQVNTGSDGLPVLSLLQNGQLLVQYQDYANSITSGNPGIYIFPHTALTSAQATKWSGGNAGVLPFGVISGNAGVPGATISYSGLTSGSVTADGTGNYTLPNLANGMYTITPTLAGYTFSPTSSTVTISNGNATGINFTAISSNNALVTTNNLLLSNGFLVTNSLLAPDLLGGTNDWS